MGRANAFTPEERVAAFWSKVDKNGPTVRADLGPCWLWTAAKHPAGYGTFWDGARLIKAHRFAWKHLHGPIPPGVQVLHRCDNPPCVNPDHLFVGTQKDNIDDAMSKGRLKPPPEHCGEAQHLSKLTADQVRAIRAEYLKGDSERGGHGLARKYGVTRAAIYSIVTGQTWKHVAQKVA